MTSPYEDVMGEPKAARSGREQQEVPAFSTVESLVAICVVGVLALMLGVSALLSPTRTTQARTLSYAQAGEFSYSATSNGDSIYGPAGLKSGEPVFLDQVGPLEVRFDYELASSETTVATGAASMVATVALAQGITREFVVVPNQPFTGGEVDLAAKLPLNEIQDFVRQSQRLAGDVSGGGLTTVSIEPTIRVRGTLGNQPLNASFEPKLQFVLSGPTLSLNENTASPDEGDGDPLNPTESGTVQYPVEVANTVSLLVAEPTVMVSRIVGLGIAVLSLLVGLRLARPLFRGDGPGGGEERIRRLYGSRIVEVSDLTVHAGPVADVVSVEALADLAKRYESMIMHVRSAGNHHYLVWDNGLLYRFRTPIMAAPGTATTTGPPSSSTAQNRDAHDSNGRPAGVKN